MIKTINKLNKNTKTNKGVMMMKKIITVVMAVALLLTINVTTADASAKTKVYLNDKEIIFTDALPYIQEGRTLMPVRAISEELGMDVKWYGNSRTVSINNGVISLVIDSKNANVRNRNVELDVPATIRNSRTYVPLRFVAENFGVEVDWSRRADGGINVYLTQETKTNTGTERPEIDAKLPKENILAVDSFTKENLIRSDVSIAYHQAVANSVVKTANGVEFYVPVTPSGNEWRIGGSAEIGTPVRMPISVAHTEGKTNSILVDWNETSDVNVTARLMGTGAGLELVAIKVFKDGTIQITENSSRNAFN